MDHAFLKGCSLGLAMAAPVGPIGVLCIRRSLAEGAKVGFFTGLGAAAADAFYGAVAAFGLTAISGFLTSHAPVLQLVGGLFLAYLGLKTFLAKPAGEAAKTANHATAFTSTLFLTLTNPMTIFSFMIIFSAFMAGERQTVTSATFLTAGVFLGSAVWWLFLSHAAAYFRARITPAWMQQINRLSGVIIFAFSIKVLFFR